MNKSQARLAAFNFLETYGTKIRAKLNNICGKTGKYNVPGELFQRRTHRKNRVLISWKTVNQNNLTIEQLASFSGGVTVEFINEDFFLPANQLNPLFRELILKIGSDDVVSAMISIRSESGSTSSAIQRQYFNELMNDTEVIYKGNRVIVNEHNYQNYAINQIATGGKGNDKWEGFLFISIKGGQQDTIESHTGNMTIFNPACEFANESVCLDIDLVLSYFALLSINTNELNEQRLSLYNQIISNIRRLLSNSLYESEAYTGNLLDYCNNHPSVLMLPGQLCDPIQVAPINIEDFGIDDIGDQRNLDLTHDEPVTFERYYWDSEQNCILTPSRPTNMFWSKHLSNMMQQNFTLNEYFRHEEEIVERRRRLLNQN